MLASAVGASATSASRRRRTWTSANASACSTSRRAGKVCGSRFVYLTGVGAISSWRSSTGPSAKSCVQGVQAYGGSRSRAAGHHGEVRVPAPRGEHAVCNIENGDLCLAGTAEILLGGVYMDEVVTEKELPIKMAAFSHCFRTEAGAATPPREACTACTSSAKTGVHHLPPRDNPRAFRDELISIEEECAPSSDSLQGARHVLRGPRRARLSQV